LATTSLASGAYWRRKITDAVMRVVTFLCTVLVLAPLFFILFFLASAGAQALDVDFFTKLPGPAGEPGGGMANAVTGTLMLLGIAGALGIPIGVLGGVYLAEYPNSRLAFVVRFFADVLSGIPSIIMGLFAFTAIVLTLVPQSIREASLGLGIPQWKTLVRVIVPTAAGGIVTGTMVGMARIAGETAPLLFTAFGNRFWNWDIRQPVSALPLEIYSYAVSPFTDWHRQAWAGALVLVTIILVINVAARYAASRQVNVR
jgi:phosphate transport system permease protein